MNDDVIHCVHSQGTTKKPDRVTLERLEILIEKWGDRILKHLQQKVAVDTVELFRSVFADMSLPSANGVGQFLYPDLDVSGCRNPKMNGRSCNDGYRQQVSCQPSDDSCGLGADALPPDSIANSPGKSIVDKLNFRGDYGANVTQRLPAALLFALLLPAGT
jgi:hypothetical protein